MHIPDGILDPITSAVTGCVAIAGVGYSLHQLRDQLGTRLVPLVGVTSAAIFAGQMVNFPLLFAPASGHLMGGVLAAALLGPWGGAVAITAVLFVQCLVFGDGGLTALGANVVNMALLGSWGGHAIYQALRRLLGGARGAVFAAALTAWLIVPISALAFAGEMACAGDFAFVPLSKLMLLFHVPIGLGEALITGLSLAWVARVRPDLLDGSADTSASLGPQRYVTAAGLTIALAVAIFAAPWASELSDGLESVASQFGFADRAQTVAWAPFPDYEWKDGSRWTRMLPAWLLSGGAATAALGVVGTLATWLLAHWVARGVRGEAHS